MSHALRRTTTGALLVLAGSLTAALAAASPAVATASANPTSAATVCLPSAPAKQGPRHAHDPMRITPSQGATVQRAVDQARSAISTGLPDLVRINVRAHVIKGTHKGDKYATVSQITQAIANLNAAYGGEQADGAYNTRYRFRLYSTDTRTKDSWYHLTYRSTADTSMRRSLHLGLAHGLNIYFVRPKPVDGGVLLGWATFPWQQRTGPRLDGVVVNVDSLNGGSATNYNLADTVVHETGHWLGLLHTFEGGCSAAGDGVIDTPGEAEPSYQCEDARDTCGAPGTDPVHNFMDYSWDTCMNMFTAGQAKRIDHMWSMYRTS